MAFGVRAAVTIDCVFTITLSSLVNASFPAPRPNQYWHVNFTLSFGHLLTPFVTQVLTPK